MISTPLPPVRDVLAGRHLVVTGATGFLGKVWLSHLLTHVPDIGKVTLLVRPPRGGSARDRVARDIDTSPAWRPLREAVPDGLGAWLDARVEVLDADITRPACGLDPREVEKLARTADAVVHIAGLTAFQPDPCKGFPVNVDGTRHVAELAQRFRVPRVLHVSTAYVAGTRDGVVDEQFQPGVSPRGVVFDVEAELAAVQQIMTSVRSPADRIEAVQQRASALGWPNLYTFSKALGEHLLATMEVDAVSARPSVIECARTFPLPTWNEGLNTSGPIMWFCGTPFPTLPANAHHTFDIIPVDAVARWLTVILVEHLRGEAEEVYHLASGDVNPATFDRIVELTALGKRRHAERHGATLLEKLVAQIDVTPRSHDDPHFLTPERLQGWGKDLAEVLEEADPASVLPGFLRRRFGDALTERVRKARRTVAKTNRTLSRMSRMLAEYRPFIHDHDWTFQTDHIRRAVARLHPSDRAMFHDDVSDMCWRSYWLDVQYEGMVRWAFPLLEGGQVPTDPPSVPALSLGLHPHAWDAAARQGVA